MHVNNNVYYIILGNHSRKYGPIFNCLEFNFGLIYQKKKLGL